MRRSFLGFSASTVRLAAWLAFIAPCVPVAIPSSAQAAVVNIDVKSKYGLTRDGFARAIADAKAHFRSMPDDTVILALPAGVVDLSKESGGRATIDVTGVQPGPQGRLVFQGAGKDKTTIIFSRDLMGFYGRDVSHVSFVGMHLTRPYYTVSQGTVVSVAPGVVTLDIQDGFPSPADIFEPKLQQGRYLRQCTSSKDSPEIVEPDNTQIAWSTTQQVSGRRWQMNLTRPVRAPYPVGSLIGIKSKHGGDACWFARGTDIVFDDIAWTHKTRCTFRGISNVQILNSIAKRPPPIKNQAVCLGSSEGGPQILGEWGEPPLTGAIVDNFKAEATGDDSVAFMNATGVIRNSNLSDSFARCILLYESPTVKLENNNLVRCPLLHKKR